MNLSPGFNQYDVRIDNHRISFRCRYVPDSEDVVLFVHGLACAWDSFRHALDFDKFSDKTLLFVDLVGFGDSDKPENFSYAMQDQAAVVGALLATLPQRRIHLVAHSMGAAVVLLLPPVTYARVRSFANIEGNLIGEDCGIFSRGVSAMPYDRYRNRGYARHLAAFENHDMFRFERTTPFAIYHSAASLVRCSDSGDLLTRFEKLDCRKAYFFGEENKDIPVLEKLDFIPKYMISNSGHGMMSENPDGFYTRLNAFIDT